MRPRYLFVCTALILSAMEGFTLRDAQAVIVDGTAFLDGASDHSGIMLRFVALSPPAVTDSTYTDAGGYFAKSIVAGLYDLEYSKSGYLTYAPDYWSFPSNYTLPPATLYEPLPIPQLAGDQSGVLGPGSYQVVNEITVPNGQTLTIAPGTQLLFTGHYRLMVYGSLRAIGTPEDSIIFARALAVHSMKWRGVWFLSGSDACSLKYCSIQHGWGHEVPAGYLYSSGGGVHCEYSSPDFADCTISNDSAKFGGGVYCYYASPSFSNCVIRDNYAEANGGGIGGDESSPTFDRCTISSNTADPNSGTYGRGGGLWTNINSTPVFTNCSIVGNVAASVGGVHSTARLFNSIVANSASYAITRAVEVRYCDFFGNDAVALSAPGGFGQVVGVNANGTPADSFMNIFDDPLFTNQAASNFHLLPGSPCIDAGDPAQPLDADSTVNDIGAFPFLLNVIVHSPNGGEIWHVVDTNTVSWFGMGFTGGVRIELDRNYPSGVWDTLAANAPNTGVFDWTVAGSFTTHARMRITSVDVPSASDTSDGDFNIAVSLAAPMPVSPISGYVAAYDEAVDYCWNPVSSATLYRIQWDDSINFSSPEELTTADTCLAHIIVPSRTWYWHVRAENVINGPWSDTDSVIVTRYYVDTWMNPAGGEWTDSLNWSPPQVPGPLDTVLITLPGDYTVTVPTYADVSQLMLGSGVPGDTTTQTLSVNCASCQLSIYGNSVVRETGVLSASSGATVALTGASISLTDSGQVALAGTSTLNVGASNTLDITTGQLDLTGTTNLTNGGSVRNAGTVRRQGAGISTLTGNYRETGLAADSSLIVSGGRLMINAPDSAVFYSITTIASGSELSVQRARFQNSSAISGTGTLSLTAGNAEVAGDFDLSGTLTTTGGAVNFHPSAAVSLDTFQIESTAAFSSTVMLNTAVVNLQGGSTLADFNISSQCNWSAGTLSGTANSTLTLNSGVNLFVTGPGLKALDTRDLVIDGTGSVAGAGVFSLVNGADVTVGTGGTLALGDSLTINGATDTLFNRGMLTISAPTDTCVLNLFVLNDPAGRTPGTIDVLSGRCRCNGIRNHGSVTLYDQTQLWVIGTFTNNSMVDLSQGSLWIASDSLFNMASGVIRLTGDASITGPGMIENLGYIFRLGGGLRTPSTCNIGIEFHNRAGGFVQIEADTLALTNPVADNADTIYIYTDAALDHMATFQNLPGGVIVGGGAINVTINNLVMQIIGRSVLLSWTSIPGAASYDVYRATEPYDNIAQYTYQGNVIDPSFFQFNSATLPRAFYRVVPRPPAAMRQSKTPSVR